MIRYDVSAQVVSEKIEEMRRGWLRRARERTATFRALRAYNVLNYTVACKPCNSGLKGSYFPILGDYDLVGEDPKAMMSERPMLIYPIGNFDIDPEEAISFYGVVPRSIAEDPDVRKRGQAVITFFRLDDVKGRRNLFWERAVIIVLLYVKLRTAAGDAAFVDTLTSSSAPHANCARSFVRLFEADSAKAARVAKAAHDFVTSKS